MMLMAHPWPGLLEAHIHPPTPWAPRSFTGGLGNGKTTHEPWDDLDEGGDMC